MMTYEETDALLKLAVKLSERSVKQIAAESGVNADTLYKWKTMDRHLMPQNADLLYRYFIEKEPQTILAACVANYVLTKLYVYLTSSTD